MLEVKELSKSFKSKKVLTDFSFSFNDGVYGLLAPNGAGKTTLLRCIAQIYPEGRKCIYYNGEQIEKIKDINSVIGYLPQQFGLFKNLSVFDAMTLIANFKGINKKNAALQITKLLETVNLSDSVKTKVGALSGGMLRRLGIASALLGDPELLLLDEPTAGLDPEERLRFKSVIAGIGTKKSVILSTHIVEDVEALCNNIVIMKNGKVAACGSCESICQAAENKVFLVPESKIGLFGSNFRSLGQTVENGETFIRLLSQCAGNSEYSVLPTVEDGYICVIDSI